MMLNRNTPALPRSIFLSTAIFFVSHILQVTGAASTESPATFQRLGMEGRQSLSLDGVWKFCPAFKELELNHEFMQQDLKKKRTYPKDAIDKHFGWIEPEFNDEVWWDIDVPSSWNQSFPDLWSYEGHGWYRKKVNIPQTWEGNRVVFHSDGANYRTVLYVNGTKVGVHEGGYVAFSFPIHKYLKFGEENTFAVSVDNEALADRCPSERHDWWNHGGLYRSVCLEVTDMVFIDDAVVTTDATTDPAQVRVKAQIHTETSDVLAFDFIAHLSDPDGKTVAVGPDSMSLNGMDVTVEFLLQVEDALLWSPDDPDLYSLALEIRDTKTQRRKDLWETRIGIRSIQIDGTRLLVNGKPFLIKGLNRYENYPDTGMTPNDSALRRDVDLIKSMGGNAVRCHYPHSPGTYDLYDEVGLFTVCEVPLYQWGRPGHSTKNLDAAKVQLDEMIRSLRNHPSVLMWSVSNETRITPVEDNEEHRKLSEMVVKGNVELVEMAHRLDPTRPVIEPSNRWPDDVVFEKTDIHAVNVYLGARTPHVDSLPYMRETMHAKMDALREKYPNKPILVSEFGSWGLYGFKADYYPGEKYQAALLRNYWEGFLEEPGFIGGFIWCFADSDVHRTYYTIYEMRCAYGIFDIHRRPKEAVEVMCELWLRDSE
ncbi:MAG: glycoside hydrolase family 2 TIM barrel-domain containing protein [bacterium]